MKGRWCHWRCKIDSLQRRNTCVFHRESAPRSAAIRSRALLRRKMVQFRHTPASGRVPSRMIAASGYIAPQHQHIFCSASLPGTVVVMGTSSHEVCLIRQPGDGPDGHVVEPAEREPQPVYGIVDGFFHSQTPPPAHPPHGRGSVRIPPRAHPQDEPVGAADRGGLRLHDHVGQLLEVSAGPPPSSWSRGSCRRALS